MGDPVVFLASLILVQLISTLGLLGLLAARAWMRSASAANARTAVAEADQRDALLGRIVSGPPHPHSGEASDASGFRLEISHPRPERLVTTPPLVSLPVTSLAGLPISRPVLEGWLGGRKRGKGAARNRVVRKIVSGECSACRENRARGRNYCRDCGRRLSPFL
jgi:hypothetical protein